MAAGDVITWRERGFSWKVVATGANDFQLDYTGNGGVKLQVLKGSDGWVNVAAVGNDPTKIQMLLDNFEFVRCDPGLTFNMATGLIATAKNIAIDFSGATFDVNFEGTFFQGPGALLVRKRTNLGLIRCNRPNSKAIDVTWFSYCTIGYEVISIRDEISDGIYGKGNGLGTGAYYNNFIDGYITGLPGYANQRAVAFERATSGGFSADGPNANNFSNFKRVAGVTRAFDIQSGNGNLFDNIQIESVRDIVFAFNDHGGTQEKAVGNVFTNWRIEGSTAAIPVKFFAGSRNNRVVDGYETSVSAQKFINESDQTNFYAPNGREVVIDFYGAIGAAGTVHRLTPQRVGGLGGAAVPFTGFVHSIVARTSGVPSNVLGTAQVKVYKSGTLHAALPILTFNNPNYNDRRGVATGLNITDPGQVCIWESAHALAIDVETSGDWGGSSGVVHVQIIYMS